jgi:hypothetical protein
MTTKRYSVKVRSRMTAVYTPPAWVVTMVTDKYEEATAEADARWRAGNYAARVWDNQEHRYVYNGH